MKPGTHKIIKGAWSEEAIDRCKAEIDGITNWQEKGYGKRVSRKDFPPTISQVIRKASTPEFIAKHIGEVLIPDPELHGGGVHSSLPGGYLRMHRDFNKSALGYRVANLLLYLNRTWSGGELRINGDRIAPEANTMVILSPEDWHGHPEPCGERRDSIALYYYSSEKPEDFVERLTTDYEWTEKTK